ncbi:MAG: LD-carboxypeptidase, partial [Proteobacteria bacterium]|nr:LD-carboxypeptidase [Pseudomonadota bacterium]MBU1736625.1 LD-carboxypeptidase [Pseudomonadota bacterium]
MQLPPAIRPGDTIGLITPAGPVMNHLHVQEGIALLERAGYQVKITADLSCRDGYLAGTDQQRAKQFASVWQDPEISGVLAVRGGYGSLRLLPFLDLEMIRKNPKPLVGFSDITVLLNVISRETGMVTFHGPMLNTLSRSDAQSASAFFEALEGTCIYPAAVPEVQILAKGNCTGQLIGGNLASLVHLLGTPYDFPWEGAVLFIEDTGEPLYRIDRMLTHLHAAGKFAKLSGLILGTFTDNDNKEV